MEAIGTETESCSGIYSFKTLVDSNLSSPAQVVEGLLSEGQNVIFAGYFGVGKTMFAGQLSICLATGKAFLGRAIKRPYRVVFLDYETGPGAIRDRLIKQSKAAGLTEQEHKLLDENFTYVNMLDEECPFYGLQLDETGIRKLAEFLEYTRAEILIVDNLGWFVEGDLNDAEEVKHFYQELHRLRMQSGPLEDGVILLLHHLTKPRGEKNDRAKLLTAPREYLSQTRGSQRLLDYAACRLALSEELIDDHVIHVINGVNRTGAFEPLVMQLGFETLSFKLHGNNELRYKQAFIGKPVQEKIFNALPEWFSWTQAKDLRIEGKPVSPDTLSATLRTATFNEFVLQDSTTKLYRKLFQASQTLQ